MFVLNVGQKEKTEPNEGLCRVRPERTDVKSYIGDLFMTDLLDEFMSWVYSASFGTDLLKWTIIAIVAIFVLALLIIPIIQLIFSWFFDLFMTENKFFKNKKHGAYNFDARTLDNTFSVRKSELKYRALVEKHLSQNEPVNLQNGSKYTVDHFTTLQSSNWFENIKRWNTVKYYYRLTPKKPN